MHLTLPKSQSQPTTVTLTNDSSFTDDDLYGAAFLNDDDDDDDDILITIMRSDDMPGVQLRLDGAGDLSINQMRL